MRVDFGQTATDYARHRAGFPPSFFERLAESPGFGPEMAGCAVLDLGTGTGTLAREFARRGAKVTGIDPAEKMLEAARALAAEAGLDVTFRQGTAEATGMPEDHFDLVMAGQAWHWFDQEAALREISRVLRRDGRLLVAYLDWVAEPNGPVETMYRLRAKYNPGWKEDWPLGHYPQGPDDLRLPGFVLRSSFLYVEPLPYTHVAWRGRMRAYAGIGGSLPEEIVRQFDEEFAQVLAREFPEEPLAVPHKVWGAIFARA